MTAVAERKAGRCDRYVRILRLDEGISQVRQRIIARDMLRATS
jgi:hypothetical protein